MLHTISSSSRKFPKLPWNSYLGLCAGVLPAVLFLVTWFAAVTALGFGFSNPCICCSASLFWLSFLSLVGTFHRPVSYLPTVKAFLLPNQALLVLNCAQWGFQPHTVIFNVIVFFVVIVVNFDPLLIALHNSSAVAFCCDWIWASPSTATIICAWLSPAPPWTTSIFLSLLRAYLNLTSTADTSEIIFIVLISFFNLIFCKAIVKSLAEVLSVVW